MARGPLPENGPRASSTIPEAEPGSQRVAQSGICAVPHPGDVSIGSDQHGSGGRYLAQDWKLPITGVLGVDRQHPSCPRGDVEPPGLAEVQKNRAGVVEECEHTLRATG